MDLITRLAAIEGIKRAKARYWIGVDTKNVDLLRSVFSDDVEVDCRGTSTDPISGFNFAPGADEIIRGADNVVECIIASLKDVVSVHHASAPDIEIAGPTSGKATWPMVDRLLFSAPASFKEVVGYGYYHDTYELVAQDWKIKTVRLVRTRLDFIPW